jgi:hypothetical protein
MNRLKYLLPLAVLVVLTGGLAYLVYQTQPSRDRHGDDARQSRRRPPGPARRQPAVR